MSEKVARALAPSVDQMTKRLVEAWVAVLRQEAKTRAEADAAAQKRTLARFQLIEERLDELDRLIKAHHGEIEDARYKVTRAALVRLIDRIDKGVPPHGDDTTDR